MAFVPKARDLEASSMTGATIRLAKRESFDSYKATQAPSATGGAPKTKAAKDAQLPSVGPTMTPADQYRQRTNNASLDTPILPFLLKSRTSIEEYNNLAPGFADQLANDFRARGVAVEGMDVGELAQRTVAFMQRAADPMAVSTDLPSRLRQNANAREVSRILQTIRARRAAR